MWMMTARHRVDVKGRPIEPPPVWPMVRVLVLISVVFAAVLWLAATVAPEAPAVEPGFEPVPMVATCDVEDV
jgi:hypothetical protein